MPKTVLAPLFAARYCMISELRLVAKSCYLRIKSLCYEVSPSPSVRSYGSMVPIQEYISNFVHKINSSILTRICPHGTWQYGQTILRRSIFPRHSLMPIFWIMIHLRHYIAVNLICSDMLGRVYRKLHAHFLIT